MSDGNDYVNFFKTCEGRAVGWLSQYLSYPRGYPHGIMVTITEEVRVIRVGGFELRSLIPRMRENMSSGVPEVSSKLIFDPACREV